MKTKPNDGGSMKPYKQRLLEKLNEGLKLTASSANELGIDHSDLKQALKESRVSDGRDNRGWTAEMVAKSMGVSQRLCLGAKNSQKRGQEGEGGVDTYDPLLSLPKGRYESVFHEDPINPLTRVHEEVRRGGEDGVEESKLIDELMSQQRAVKQASRADFEFLINRAVKEGLIKLVRSYKSKRGRRAYGRKMERVYSLNTESVVFTPRSRHERLFRLDRVQHIFEKPAFGQVSKTDEFRVPVGNEKALLHLIDQVKDSPLFAALNEIEGVGRETLGNNRYNLSLVEMIEFGPLDKSVNPWRLAMKSLSLQTVAVPHFYSTNKKGVERLEDELWPRVVKELKSTFSQDTSSSMTYVQCRYTVRGLFED